jgi:hypothetical protein
MESLRMSRRVRALPPAPARACRPGAPLAAALALLLAACASAGGGAGGESIPVSEGGVGQISPSQRRETIMIESGMLQYFPEAGSSPIETEIGVPAARAWQVLPDAYEQLGLPMNEIIGPQKQIGTGMVRLQGRVGRVSLSRVIDCGYTSGIANADGYSVNMLVRTQVVPRDSTTSTLRTLVLASGRQAATGGGGVVSCPSSGELERRIATAVRERAAK